MKTGYSFECKIVATAAKPSPGPWHHYGRMTHDSQKTVAGMARIQMDGDASDAWRFKTSEHHAFCTNLADAPLIAAAPELLACLREMVSDLLSHAQLGINEKEVAMLQRAEAAITKATGGDK